MKRGRPRKFDPSIPAHIDQSRIPTRCYWHPRDHYWYTIQPGPDRSHQHIRIAGRSATLAQLHSCMENIQAGGKRSMAWLHQRFCESETWKHLAPATQRDYNACAKVLTSTKTRVGFVSSLDPDKLTRVHLQTIIDAIATTRPAMANHVKRYLGRLYVWGMQRGKCRERVNPAHGLQGAKEKAQFKMPSRQLMWEAISFARERGQRKAKTKGSCPPYLWIVMLLAYRLRLRGIEVITLTDANETPQGIRTNRRKGSLDNIVKLSLDTTEAWEVAKNYRDAIWKKKGTPIPMNASDRVLIVNQSGERLLSDALWNAWKRFMTLAIREGLMTKEQRFTLHGLKHRGITDSKDPDAGGHVDPRMKRRYNHRLPEVDPAGHDEPENEGTQPGYNP